MASASRPSRTYELSSFRYQRPRSLQGPKTTECQYCSLAKIKRQISRRSSERNIDKPYIDLHIDWTDLKETHARFIQVMFIHDTFSRRTFLYFMTTHNEEK